MLTLPVAHTAPKSFDAPVGIAPHGGPADIARRERMMRAEVSDKTHRDFMAECARRGVTMQKAIGRMMEIVVAEPFLLDHWMEKQR